MSSLVLLILTASLALCGALPPPIVYTIAGSDSGGGAGIQADLHAIHAMGCHGCSAVTCLTAQNSCGVSAVHAPPAAFLRAQLECLLEDLPPRAIKIGMLGTRELAETVGDFLKNITISSTSSSRKPWVVVDPVMISTSGHKLIDDEAERAMKTHIFPYADMLTPNKYEAEALLGRKLHTYRDVEEGAKDLLQMGVRSVLIKGGHTLTEKLKEGEIPEDLSATIEYAQDYFLSAIAHEGEARLCDGDRGIWLRTERYDSIHTHGTGCTLSSAIASALALGHQRREIVDKTGANYEGATSAIDLADACCLAKAYVSAGIGRGVGLGKGSGPVVHTHFPSSCRHYPSIAMDPEQRQLAEFRSIRAWSSDANVAASEDVPVLGRILPIVDSVEWVERLVNTPGVSDIQLRVKDETVPDRILERVHHCEKLCRERKVRLWVNDHWKAAIRAGCFGVHVGQEDLVKCAQAGGLEALRSANVALGVSTHSYGELAAALAVRPSYISLGPVFGTASKKVNFDPQGLSMVTRWRGLIPPHIPLVTIGGISDVTAARRNQEAGADCVAVIGAVTQSPDVAEAVRSLNKAMV